MFFGGSQGVESTPSFHQLYVGMFLTKMPIFFINFINFCPLINNKWPNFLKVFISLKCVYKIYLAYLLFILSKKMLFSFFRDFLAILQISQNSGIFQFKKLYSILKSLLQTWIFLLWVVFVLFLGLYSDKFHYNSVNSKEIAIFCYVK